MSVITKSFQFGEHQVTLETGAIARQADGAVLVNMDDTVVLVTVVAKRDANHGRDFFPLSVNYQERTYAAGKIPGGFFRREGRPSEAEVLICRLIDRPIRPLFPKGFENEVQVIATVMSYNPNIQPDIPALIGASAALAVSGVPSNGPIGAARVGYIENQYVLNPTLTQIKEESSLNLVVAGTKDAVLMVESEADQLSEEVMLGAVMYGHEQMQTAIQAINELVEETGTTTWDWAPQPVDENLVQQVNMMAKDKIGEAYLVQDKLQRQEQLKEIRTQTIETLRPEDSDEPSEAAIKSIIESIEDTIVRGRVIDGEARIDGRSSRDIRNIAIKVGILPRVHGSALFTRGETQAIVAATLGMGRDAQMIDALEGDSKEHFMLHYNFPPYCVGETGMVGSPKRREIGHGRLAKRAMLAVVPNEEESPYVLRVVSEITESNGSSSMATVCGTSLALMDAGVNVKAPVAGIAMGLVKEGNQFVVLSDILGDEDHLGDMDFKVAGTAAGITALQMDIKIEGITKAIMESALSQAKEGRLHILGEMNKVLSEPRVSVSAFAPRIVTIQIHPDKIRDIIGKGGATIQALTKETNTTIDISDDGIVKVAAVESTACDEAVRHITELTAEAEVGQIYEGKVARIADFGAFVTILPGKDGLVHVSQISNERVENVSGVLQEGQIVRVKVLEIDRQGRIRLSMKALLEENQG